VSLVKKQIDRLDKKYKEYGIDVWYLHNRFWAK
jgi:hypothetical protein